MPATPTTLADLARAAGPGARLSGDGTTLVTGLAYDSRRVRPGDLFFCIRGTKSDGHGHAPAAVAAGASALVCERPLGLGVPEILVPDARAAMPLVGASFYGRPTDRLLMVGVTGTNGKTTTAFLLESVLRAAGHSTGLIGTIETRVAGVSEPGVRTTPESLDLQELCARMVTAGVDAVAMEVTSHALVLNRVDGVIFSAAGFTNLSQDHLDFHPSLEDYFAAKASLFTPTRARAGAANADDAYGRRLLAEAPIPMLSFGLDANADVRAVKVELGAAASRFTIVTPQGDLEVETRLVGAFNVSNHLAACAIALQAGIEPGAIAEGLNALRSVPGRFESVDLGQGFAVIVDYAHTPDSLDNVLRTARGLVAPRGRLVCVFGCGGDRDRAKRPLMGATAARLADICVVTSDNPRSEDPETIIAEILAGMPGRAQGLVVEPDRRAAIATALGAAVPGDVVVIAGKGHETGQTFADRTVPFDDRTVAAEVLRALGHGGSP